MKQDKNNLVIDLDIDDLKRFILKDAKNLKNLTKKEITIKAKVDEEDNLISLSIIIDAKRINYAGQAYFSSSRRRNS